MKAELRHSQENGNGWLIGCQWFGFSTQRNISVENNQEVGEAEYFKLYHCFYLITTLKSSFCCFTAYLHSLYKNTKPLVTASKKAEKQGRISGRFLQGDLSPFRFGSTGNIQQSEMAFHFLQYRRYKMQCNVSFIRNGKMVMKNTPSARKQIFDAMFSDLTK